MATRNHYPSSGSSRDRGHHSHNHYKHYYKYLVGILSIIFCTPAFAEGATSVAANPQASISGAVANQAVQINQGSLSTQSFARGHFCNGPVLSLSPYYLQTQGDPGASLTRNFGGQLTISMPLDGGSVEKCKALAQIALQKGRLDYELVRVKECINIFKQGFMIHPSSAFYPICADVIPIASVSPKSLEEASSLPLPASLKGS